MLKISGLFEKNVEPCPSEFGDAGYQTVHPDYLAAKVDDFVASPQ